MADVIALVLPFFGLIAIGFGVAKITKQPLEALGWMNTFIIYVALPALFFKLLSKTPVEELTQWRFIVGASLSTYMIYCAVFLLGILRTRGNVAEAAIMGFAGAYGNIGYMGPGLALLAFGEPAVVPVALIFCFDNIMHFTLAPMLMALSGQSKEKESAFTVAGRVVKRIALHPFILATMVGVLAAIFKYQPPQAAQTLIDYLANAAAPCALFAMGVSLALRPLKRVPLEATFIMPAKLVLQPLLVYVILINIGDFPDIWIYSAMLLAGLPTATNVFVIAQQYDTWVNRASAMVLMTTVASVITVTALLYMMKNNLIPL